MNSPFDPPRRRNDSDARLDYRHQHVNPVEAWAIQAADRGPSVYAATARREAVKHA